MTTQMRRVVTGVLMLVSAILLFGSAAGPALAAEIGIAVGAPESATVGDTVEYIGSHFNFHLILPCVVLFLSLQSFYHKYR